MPRGLGPYEEAPRDGRNWNGANLHELLELDRGISTIPEGVRGYVNALSKGLGSRTRADTFDEEAVTRVEGRKRVDTQNIELHDVVRMAHHFGVSCTAMLYRLQGLAFVTADSDGFRSPIPIDFDH